MEKLIELLNEYEYDIRREKTLRWMTNWCLYYIQSINSYLNLKIISKEYGFIKWLVDNDKIDLDKLKDNTSFTMLTHSIWLWCEWHTAHEWESILRAIWTNAIIAYLSIQDEPIKFLISILK